MLKIIARIKNDFPEKFGIPRQSGLCDNISTVVFEKEYRCDEALRGIDGYSHLWLIWGFSKNAGDNEKWSPTVRPPRLGGNTRMGVFATRSPNRPNPLGLSSVKLVGMRKTEDGTVLDISGADLANGTPIYDIKPYLAYTDSHPDAVCGFADEKASYSLDVVIPEEIRKKLPPDKTEVLYDILSQDPRPSYISEPERIYGFGYAGYEIRFRVENGTLFVTDAESADDQK